MPPRTPPQWEESSAVFVYRVWVFLVVSFSGQLLMESFFRVLRQTSLVYSKHCFHGMFHKWSDRLLAVPVFGCIDDIICLNQNLVVDAVDLLRSMVVPHQISHPVHRIYSICRSFILPVILEASLCATDPVRGSRALRHNFCWSGATVPFPAGSAAVDRPGRTAAGSASVPAPWGRPPAGPQRSRPLSFSLQQKMR